jgi:hypothetical protein
MTTRTNLPLSTLVPKGILDIPAGTAIDVTNGMNIPVTTSGIPASPDEEDIFIFVQTTNGADKAITIRKGANPPAFRAGLGDLVVTAHAATGGGIIGPLESARHKQSDGSINVDFASGTTGTITAYLMPRRW